MRFSEAGVCACRRPLHCIGYIATTTWTHPGFAGMLDRLSASLALLPPYRHVGSNGRAAAGRPSVSGTDARLTACCSNPVSGRLTARCAAQRLGRRPGAGPSFALRGAARVAPHKCHVGVCKPRRSRRSSGDDSQHQSSRAIPCRSCGRHQDWSHALLSHDGAS